MKLFGIVVGLALIATGGIEIFDPSLLANFVSEDPMVEGVVSIVAGFVLIGTSQI